MNLWSWSPTHYTPYSTLHCINIIRFCACCWWCVNKKRIIGEKISNPIHYVCTSFWLLVKHSPASATMSSNTCMQLHGTIHGNESPNSRLLIIQSVFRIEQCWMLHMHTVTTHYRQLSLAVSVAKYIIINIYLKTEDWKLWIGGLEVWALN